MSSKLKSEALPAVQSQANRSYYVLGGWLSLAIAVLYIVIGVSMALDPAERYRGDEYAPVLAAHPEIALFWRPVFVVIAILTLAVINALNRMVRSPDGRGEAWLEWTTLMAYAGCFFLAVDWMREFVGMSYYLDLFRSIDTSMTAIGDKTLATMLEGIRLPHRLDEAGWAQLAAALDSHRISGSELRQLIAALKASVGMEALTYDGYLAVDTNYIWKFGGLGAWYLTMTLIGWRNHVLGSWTGTLGVLVGVSLLAASYFAVSDDVWVIRDGVQIALLQIPAALGGAVFGPLFHFSVGVLLLKRAKAQHSLSPIPAASA